MNATCRNCGHLLTFSTLSITRDCDHLAIGPYCKDCGPVFLADLMDYRKVEVYNDVVIYVKDGKFYPYWECPYYFTTLEDCKKRIDMKYSAIISLNILKELE